MAKENRFIKEVINKTNNLKNWQASVLLALIGFISYFDGLKNQFQTDDLVQIVNNKDVHSLSNLGHFFTSGTFYSQTSQSLTGAYYRPLMTTVYSVLYSLFGPHVFWYHLFQILLGIASSILLYLVFRYSLSTYLSLVLSLVFLIHPINSQSIFAIASMQDTLFFLFGILAIYLILRFNSVKSLVSVSLSLFLSLLSKETGIFFVFMAGILIYFWNKPRFKPFVYIMILPVILWFGMRVHAVHLFTKPDAGPIDIAGLETRLLTLPSIFQFYLTKLIIPVKIASGYYWVYKTFSVSHVLIPLLIDLAVLSLIIYLGIILNIKASKAQSKTYWFFCAWFGMGMFSLSQIIPLDLTANTLWFYFPMAGLLGMVGILIDSKIINIKWPNSARLIFTCLLVVILAGLTIYQGMQWKSTNVRYMHDISVSNGDYLAYANLGQTLITEGEYKQAKAYIVKSNQVFPDYSNYLNLGAAYTSLGDYAQALSAYIKAEKYTASVETAPGALYGNIAELTLTFNKGVDYSAHRALIIHYLSAYPSNSTLWFCLALLDQKNNDNKEAIQAITQAVKYGFNNQSVYENILDNNSFSLQLGSNTLYF